MPPAVQPPCHPVTEARSSETGARCAHGRRRGRIPGATESQAHQSGASRDSHGRQAMIWVSGAVFTLGVLLVWAWWRMEGGETNLAFVPWMIGAFYFVEGVYGAVYLGAFFLL